MLIPKAALIATSETDETFDGSVVYVMVDDENVEIADTDLANKITQEEEGEWEPNFTEGDQEWEVEEDDEG